MKRIIIDTAGRRSFLYPAEAPSSPLVVLNEEMEPDGILNELRQLDCPDFSLLFAMIPDWNHDLSPWDCPPVFKKGDAFTGGADAYLDQLTGQIIPEAAEKAGLAPAWYGIAGYSLAGLFAVYSLYRTDLFSRAASMSGSLWFPGFPEYAESHELLRRPEKMYFSLGDREDRTRNELMRKVRVNMEELARCYQTLGIDTTCEMNPGNHFMDPEKRIAKGIRALLA